MFDIELIRPAPAAGAFPLKPTAAIEPRWEQKLLRSSLVRLDPAARCDVPGSACAHLLINIHTAVSATARANGPTDRTLNPQEFVFFPAQTGFQIRNPGREKAECVLLELK